MTDQMREGRPPEPGTLVYDPAAGKVGEYRGKAGAYAMLRPISRDCEWQADPVRLAVRPRRSA